MSTKQNGTPGQRIASIRGQRGWGQRELAKRAGISVTFLSELENDKRAVRSDTLLRLADALGASIDFILRGVVNPQPTQEPLVIPPDLQMAAEENDWSVSDAQYLLKAQQLVVARRSRGSQRASTERTLSKDDWEALHHKLFNDA